MQHTFVGKLPVCFKKKTPLKILFENSLSVSKSDGNLQPSCSFSITNVTNRVRPLQGFGFRSHLLSFESLHTSTSRPILPDDIDPQLSRNMFKALVIEENGEWQYTTFPRTEISKLVAGVSMRDLHNTVYTNQRQISSILIRDSTLVVKLEHLKGIIQPKKLIIFEGDNPTVKNFVKSELVPALKYKTDLNDFEFVVLDLMLDSVSSNFEHRLNLLIPVITKGLDSIMSVDNREDAFLRLTQMQNALITFEYSVKEMRSAIDDLLKSDEDLSNIYISRKMKNPGADPLKLDHTKAEIMMENYSKRCEEISNEISKLKEKIGSSIHLIQLTQELTLNRTLQLQLQLSMVSLGVATGSLVASIFGMNLLNHIEKSDSAFGIAVIGIGALASASYVAIARYFARSRAQIRSITMKASTNTFFENINKPEFVTRLFDKVHDQKFFQKTVESGVGHDLSDKEAKELFEELDINKDGIISSHEYAAAIEKIARQRTGNGNGSGVKTPPPKV